MLERRVTYRRHCSYATRSNRIRLVKTPGKSFSSPSVPRWQTHCPLHPKEPWQTPTRTSQVEHPCLQETAHFPKICEPRLRRHADSLWSEGQVSWFGSNERVESPGPSSLKKLSSWRDSSSKKRSLPRRQRRTSPRERRSEWCWS